MATAFSQTVDSFRGVFVITDPQANVLYVNQSVQDVTGFARPEVVGKRPAQLWGRQMKRPFYQKMWQELSQGERPFISPVINKRKNGVQYEDMLSIAPIWEGRKAPYYIAARPDALSNKKQKQEFQKHFFAVFSPKKQDAQNITQFLYTWLGKQKKGNAPESNSASLSAASFLRDAFVAPMQETYAYRYHDRTLVCAAQKDPEAFGQLFQKYEKPVWHYFSQRVSDGAQAADLTQETFLRAFQHIQTYTPSNSSYLTYLTRIAHNLLVNHYRASGRSTPLAGDYQDTSIQPALKRIDIRWRVKKAMKSLSPVEQHILTLFYREGYACKEIATYLNKSENAVKLHLSRARKKLKPLLSS